MFRRPDTLQIQPRPWSSLSPTDASRYDKMEFSSITLALWKSMWTCLWTLGKQKSFKVWIGRPFIERQMGNIIIHGCSLSIKLVDPLDSLLPDSKGNTASIHGGQVPRRWGALRSGLTYHKTKPGFPFLIQQASACSLLKLTRESKYNVTYLSVASEILCKGTTWSRSCVLPMSFQLLFPLVSSYEFCQLPMASQERCNYPWKVMVNKPLICLWWYRYHWETGGTTARGAAGKDRLTAVRMLSLWKLDQHGKVPWLSWSWLHMDRGQWSDGNDDS